MDHCSPPGDLRFDHLSTPPDGVDDEPPNTVHDKLEADALQQEQQEGSSPGLTQQQTHQELREHARLWQQPLHQQKQLQPPQRQLGQRPFSQKIGRHGPAYQPHTQRVVGFLPDSDEGSHRGQLGGYFEQH